MRVLLIDPPTNCFTGLVKRGYPVGLCMLATSLKNNGFEKVKILDIDKAIGKQDGINFTDQRKNMDGFLTGVNNKEHPAWSLLKDTISKYEPTVVGITTMTIQYASALRVAQIAKDINKNIVVVVGGSHANVMPENILKWPYVDVVVRGDGETPIVEVLKSLSLGDESFREIPGIVTARDIKMKVNTYYEEENLDNLGMPDRESLLYQEDYSPEDMGLVLTSRGCPFKCSYCSNFSLRTRFRSIDKVIEEIKHVKQFYDTKQFMFKDDSFTLNRKRVLEFCLALNENKLRILWETTTRMDLIDDSLIKVMKKAGCNRVGLGIESGDFEMLKLLDKNVSKDKLKNGARILNSNRMFWTGYFMMGMPTEKKEQILKTLSFMKELKPSYAAIGVYKPYPGTRLFEVAEKYELVNANVDNDYFFKTNPVDYFYRNPNRRSKYIKVEEMIKLFERMEREYSIYNKQIINIGKRAMSRRELYVYDKKSFFVDLKRGIKWFFGRKAA